MSDRKTENKGGMVVSVEDMTEAVDLTLDGETLTVRLERVTPERAKYWLAEVNIENRIIRKSTWQDIQRKIVNGEWVLNGETIVFDAEGRLINGQHRLLAVAATDTPIMTLVVEGVAVDDAWETTDRTTKRTLADTLRRRNYRNANTRAATLRMIAVLREAMERGVYAESRRGKFTEGDLLRLNREHEEAVTDALRVGQRIRPAGLFGPESLMSALYFLFCEVDQVDADGFFDRLVTGTGLEEGNPILLLRQRLISEMSRPREVRVHNVMIAALTIKAFNAWREGVEVRNLRWHRGGASRERFPAVLPAQD